VADGREAKETGTNDILQQGIRAKIMLVEIGKPDRQDHMT
jgi:hypothetical protein